MSGVIKRSIEIAGHRTSITLEDEFWNALHEIADARGKTLRGLIAAIDARRGKNNLSSAVRLYVLDYYREASGTTGRRRKSSGD